MNNNLQPVDFQPYEQNIKLVKNYFKRFTTVLLSIILLLNGISYILSYVIAPSLLHSQYTDIYNALQGFEINPDNFIIDQVPPLLGSVIFYLPFILILIAFAVGFFIIYIKSKNNDINVTPQSGFSIIKTIAVILLCIYLLIIAVLICLGLILITFYRDQLSSIFGSANSIQFSVSVTLISVLLLSLVIMILHSVFMIRFSNSIIKSLNSPDLIYKGSLGLSVISIIVACFYFISCLFNCYILIHCLITGSAINISYLIPIFIYAITAAELIILSKLSSGWKKEVVYIKTAHLRDYNDGYDINSIFNIDNIPKPVEYESPGDLSVPSWEVDNSTSPNTDQSDKFTELSADNNPIAESENTNSSVECPACHSMMTSEDKFCTNCGQKLI